MIDGLLKHLASSDSYGIYQCKINEFKDQRIREVTYKVRQEIAFLKVGRDAQLKAISVTVVNDQALQAEKDRLVAEFNRRKAEFRVPSRDDITVTSWQKIKFWCKAVFTTYSLDGYLASKKRFTTPDSTQSSSSSDGGDQVDAALSPEEIAALLSPEQIRKIDAKVEDDAEEEVLRGTFRYASAVDRRQVVQRLKESEAFFKPELEQTDHAVAPVSIPVQRKEHEVFIDETGAPCVMLRDTVGGPLVKRSLMAEQEISKPAPLEPAVTYVNTELKAMTDEELCLRFSRAFEKAIVKTDEPLSVRKNKFVDGAQASMDRWFDEIGELGILQAKKLMQEANPQTNEAKLNLLTENKAQLARLRAELRVCQDENSDIAYAELLPHYLMAKAAYLHMIDKYYDVQLIRYSAETADQLLDRLPDYNFHYSSNVHARAHLTFKGTFEERFNARYTEDHLASISNDLSVIRDKHKKRFLKVAEKQIKEHGWLHIDAMLGRALTTARTANQLLEKLCAPLRDPNSTLSEEKLKELQSDVDKLYVLRAVARGEADALKDLVDKKSSKYRKAGGLLTSQQFKPD